MLDEFIRDMTPIVRLIENNQEDDARDSFNSIPYLKYKNEIDKEPSLETCRFFFAMLDEYLNSSSARRAEAATKRKVLNEFYSDVLPGK